MHRLATNSLTGNWKPGGSNAPAPGQVYSLSETGPADESTQLHQDKFRVYPRLMVSVPSPPVVVIVVSPPKEMTSVPRPPGPLM